MDKPINNDSLPPKGSGNLDGHVDDWEELAVQYLDGALSIREIYGPLLKAIKESDEGDLDEQISPQGLLWAMAGGEIAGMRNTNTMTVRGVGGVSYVFDRIEAGKFQAVDFIEAYICPDGCVSGEQTVEGRGVLRQHRLFPGFHGGQDVGFRVGGGERRGGRE